MIFTKRSDYGLRAAMELAAAYGCGPMSARQVAERGNLPEPFARKLLQELAQAGLANSERGRKGGYVLAKTPTEVTVRETLEAFETLAPVPCLDPANVTLLTEPGNAPRGAAPGDDDACKLAAAEFGCRTRAAWHLVDRKVRATLEAMTLNDLLHEVRHAALSEEMIRAS